MSKVRVDKWLWSIRIYKTRTIATKACKAGNVKLKNGKTLKPSSEISVGDTLIIKKNGINFTLEVLKLISKRVSSPLAKECYKDKTSKEELQKYESWFITAKGSEYREKGKGRPTKKERRELEDFKGDILSPFDWDEWEDFE